MVKGWRRVAQTALVAWAGTCACLALLTLLHVVVTQGSIAVLSAVPLLSLGAIMVLRIRGTPLNDVRASREVRQLWATR